MKKKNRVNRFERILADCIEGLPLTNRGSLATPALENGLAPHETTVTPCTTHNPQASENARFPLPKQFGSPPNGLHRSGLRPPRREGSPYFVAAATTKFQTFRGDKKLYRTPRCRCHNTQMRNTNAVRGKVMAGKYQK